MPRNAEDNQRIRDGRREQLLATARSVFARKGLSATKVSDIADEAGLSHGLVYHYFASKEAIFAAIVEQAISRSCDIAAAARRKRGPAWAKLHHFVCGMLDRAREEPETLVVVLQGFVGGYDSPELEATTERYRGECMADLLAMIRAGQRAGQVTSEVPSAELALVLISTIQGLAIGQFLALQRKRPRPVPRPETVLRLLRP